MSLHENVNYTEIFPSNNMELWHGIIGYTSAQHCKRYFCIPNRDTFSVSIFIGPLWEDDHLTHWGRVTHMCVGTNTIIGSDNGSSPGRRQAIIWTNAGILLVRPLGRNVSETLIENHIFSFKKMPFKVSSAKWGPFCLGLNVLSSVLPPVTGYFWQPCDQSSLV